MSSPANPKQPGFRQGASPSMVVVDGSSVVHASVVVKATVVLSASSVPRVTVWSHRHSSSWWFQFQPIFEKHWVKIGSFSQVFFKISKKPTTCQNPANVQKGLLLVLLHLRFPFSWPKKQNHHDFPAVTCLPFTFVGSPLGFFSPATSSACSLTRASCCNWLAPEA